MPHRAEEALLPVQVRLAVQQNAMFTCTAQLQPSPAAAGSRAKQDVHANAALPACPPLSVSHLPASAPACLQLRSANHPRVSI